MKISKTQTIVLYEKFVIFETTGKNCKLNPTIRGRDLTTKAPNCAAPRANGQSGSGRQGLPCVRGNVKIPATFCTGLNL